MFTLEPAAPAGHGGKNCLHQCQGSQHVQLPDCLKVFRIDGAQGHEQPLAGVVHRDVDGPELLERSVAQLKQSGGVGHVGGPGQRPRQLFARRASSSGRRAAKTRRAP